MTASHMTFAASGEGARTLAKVIRTDPHSPWPGIVGVDPAPNVIRHDFHTEEVGSLTALVGALRRGAEAGEIVVRGEPLAPSGRRAIYADEERGPAGLRVVPRCWVGFDWDSLQVAQDVDPSTDPAEWPEPPDPILDPEVGVAVALRYLPAAFREVDCVWQISASAGFKPGFRLRTWHILDKPLTGEDLKLWCEPIIRRRILDPVTLRECQPHYIAVRMVGGPDPCPARFGIYRQHGVEEVEVADLELIRERARLQARELIKSSIPPKWAHKGSAAERYIEGCVWRVQTAIDSTKHPTYVTELARAKNVALAAGLDWPSIARRIRDTYEGTLPPDEADRRRRGSTDGALRWIDRKAPS